MQVNLVAHEIGSDLSFGFSTYHMFFKNRSVGSLIAEQGFKSRLVLAVFTDSFKTKLNFSCDYPSLLNLVHENDLFIACVIPHVLVR